MSADQFGATGVLFLALWLVFILGADASKSYDTEATLKFLAWGSLIVAVFSFLLAIWGQGWLYG